MKYGAVVTQATLESSRIKPVVAIFGWNGSKMKQLHKYSGLFERRGWSTVCLTTKSYNICFRSDTEVKKISFYIIDLIKDLAKKGNPVFLYSLSNGGCGVYFHIAEALTTEGHQYFNAFKVAGSIFDSCPLDHNNMSVDKAQLTVAGEIKNPIIKAFISYALGMAYPLIQKQRFLKRFIRDLGKIPMKSPELFLYSKTDVITPYQDIEKHIANRKPQGVRIFTKCWEDSHHVAHYMKYPEQYTELLDKFIKVCLKENT